MVSDYLREREVGACVESHWFGSLFLNLSPEKNMVILNTSFLSMSTQFPLLV